jgi:hypothetical protein
MSGSLIPCEEITTPAPTKVTFLRGPWYFFIYQKSLKKRFVFDFESFLFE